MLLALFFSKNRNGGDSSETCILLAEKKRNKRAEIVGKMLARWEWNGALWCGYGGCTDRLLVECVLIRDELQWSNANRGQASKRRASARRK